jgi:hypothetical protein
MFLDIMVRTASVVVVIILLHQLFWSEGGSPRHVKWGMVAMMVGILLVVLVTARGLGNPQTGSLYRWHLLTGVPFFVALFATGIVGFTADKNSRQGRAHKILASTTMGLLVLTLSVGILSRWSHEAEQEKPSTQQPIRPTLTP